MFDALTFLKDLDDRDVQWILDDSHERQVIIGTRILEAGKSPDALYVVLQGLVGVSITSADHSYIAKLGPGELLGEISLLEGTPATSNVTAVENSLLLVLPKARLNEQLVADVGFASRWNRAVALVLSRRLRERVLVLTEQLRMKEQRSAVVDAAWEPAVAAIQEFKKFMHDVDQEIIKNGELNAERREAILGRFREFTAFLNASLGDAGPLDENVRNEIGARVQVEMHPYILLTQSAERFFSKPRGYAGDFATIDMIYTNTPTGAQRLGPLLDWCFLESASAKAVRNRRGLLATAIGEACDARGGEDVHVTTLACGPAAEIFDVVTSHALENPADAGRVRATLIDIDTEALAFVRKKAKAQACEDRLRLVEGNLVYLATGRHKLADLAPQDLIYSIGLIDYFNDKWVIKLIDYVHGLLRSGGKMILGNFHTKNVDKAFMDYVLDWKLIHRSEDDMNRLYAASKFGRGCTRIQFENEGVNMFAECVKA